MARSLWANGTVTHESVQTTALAMFTVAMLADHPAVFARLRSEVLETLGPHGKINPDNLKQMKYLRAVLNGKVFFYQRLTLPLTVASETLRLYPGV